MFNHRISAPAHNRFVRIRRRAWLAIGLCIAARAGDAALNPHSPKPSSDFQSFSREFQQ